MKAERAAAVRGINRLASIVCTDWDERPGKESEAVGDQGADNNHKKRVEDNLQWQKKVAGGWGRKQTGRTRATYLSAFSLVLAQHSQLFLLL